MTSSNRKLQYISQYCTIHGTKTDLNGRAGPCFFSQDICAWSFAIVAMHSTPGWAVEVLRLFLLSPAWLVYFRRKQQMPGPGTNNSIVHSWFEFPQSATHSSDKPSCCLLTLLLTNSWFCFSYLQKCSNSCSGTVWESQYCCLSRRSVAGGFSKSEKC